MRRRYVIVTFVQKAKKLVKAPVEGVELFGSSKVPFAENTSAITGGFQACGEGGFGQRQADVRL